VEEIIVKENNLSGITSSSKRAVKPILLQEIKFSTEERIDTGNAEMNRVLGGGLVPGSFTLIGGEPGIGKSTLMLQIAINKKDFKVLYVSGEESEHQLRMRAERIGIQSETCFILTETSVQQIFQQIEALQPECVIIDSIQTLHTAHIDSSAGSISQIRECAADFLKYAKESGVPVILIGHITKDGQIAGPKVLEHMVDTVLQFEGDRHHVYRLLRAVKNRFGSTNELGIFEMQGSGLREVSNPSEILVPNRDEPLSGTAVASVMEGLRPILIEVQALVSSAVYGTPQRTTTGFDLRRLNMLLAVLEKRCGFRLSSKDVFINMAGGIKVDDPATDLAVSCAILSSGKNIPLEAGICFAAEVGLSGELRPVSRIEQRISEAEKLGFHKMIISEYNLKGLDIINKKIKVVGLKKMEDAFRHLFS